MKKAEEHTHTSQLIAETGSDSYDQDRQQTRQEELLRWWATSLYDTSTDEWSQPYAPIYHYAEDNLPDFRFADRAVDSLATRLLDCPAETPMQFREWCYWQIDKLAAELAPKSRSEKPKRKNTKPFQCEQRGDRCFIPLMDAEGEQHIWTFPSEWLGEAQILWPVHLRRFPSGKPYVSRKVPIINPDGKRSQKNVAIHRLFLGLSAVRHEVKDNCEVHTRDGSWLNYCDGNLYTLSGSDLLDHAKLPVAMAEAKPRKKHQKGYNPWHEASVKALLRPSLDKLWREIPEENLPKLGS
jgi:hypothetical protein